MSTLPPAGAHATDTLILNSLAERIRNREEQALADLVSLRKPLLMSVSGRVLYNDHDVEELVMNCFREIWEQIGNYDPALGHFDGWIITLVRRRSLDFFRRGAAYHRALDRVQLEAHEEEASYRPREESTAADGIDTNGYRERLLEIIYGAFLSDEQREAFLLHWFENLSQREIVDRLGVPLGTIKTRLELALETVSKLVERDPLFATRFST